MEVKRLLHLLTTMTHFSIVFFMTKMTVGYFWIKWKRQLTICSDLTPPHPNPTFDCFISPTTLKLSYFRSDNNS